MASINFGITPIHAFDDVSANLNGASIDLCDNIAFDFSDSIINISASTFNDLITVSNGELEISSSAYNSFFSAAIHVDVGLKTRLEDLAVNSAEGTLALALTGSISGDINELESDPDLCGSSLFIENNFKSDLLSAIKDSNGTPIVIAAKDILNDQGVSGEVSGGRDPEAPFDTNDKLFFNMFLYNGKIKILPNIGTVDGIEFFNSTLGAGFELSGINEDTIINNRTYIALDNSGYNIYVEGERTLNPNIIGPSEIGLTDTGFSTGLIGSSVGGGVLVRLAITLDGDVETIDP